LIRFSDPTDPNSFVFDIRRGKNILIWQLENGACRGDTDTITVSTEIDIVTNDDIIQTPYNTIVRFDALSNDILSDNIDFDIITQPDVGEFFINSEGLYVYDPPPGFIGTAVIEYEVCSRNCDDNCDIAQIEVTVGDVADCFAPTLITPNGDGINDLFVIPCLESGLYPNNQLFIYNQYGDQVLDAFGYQNDWDGTYKGKAVPTGTYYFVFRANDEIAPEKGFLIIER
jgi:gliding motility-associated-like protein